MSNPEKLVNCGECANVAICIADSGDPPSCNPVECTAFIMSPLARIADALENQEVLHECPSCGVRYREIITAPWIKRKTLARGEVKK